MCPRPVVGERINIAAVCMTEVYMCSVRVSSNVSACWSVETTRSKHHDNFIVAKFHTPVTMMNNISLF